MPSCYAPYGFVKLQRPKTSPVFDTYWEFAAKRQDAFFARVQGNNGPWSDDPILKEYKFTNAYRASDRVSQYLIKNVIYSKRWSFRDTILRVLLFKLFNKIETWELLKNEFDEVCLETFNVKRYSKVLDYALSAGGRIYSAAYIIPSGPKKKFAGIRKHNFHLQLIDHLLNSNFPQALQCSLSMEEGYNQLFNVESFGKFLACQFITDLNYSEWFDFSEMEFIVPGPGAIDGIRKAFVSLGDYSEKDIIKMMADEQEHHFRRLGLQFKSLWGRPLQLIDCQNLFCEVDKYSRVAHPEIQGVSGRTRIKQKFKPNSRPIKPWYPPKWNINSQIPILGIKHKEVAAI